MNSKGLKEPDFSTLKYEETEFERQNETINMNLGGRRRKRHKHHNNNEKSKLDSIPDITIDRQENLGRV